jgi:hypothetical protein
VTQFYLGTHMIHWLGQTGVPLFVSDRRLRLRKKLPRALGPWACDSGGFTELSLHGRWQTTPREYVARVRRYRDEIGGMDWAAVQDWMCEPQILAKTGLRVIDHQLLTLRSYLELRDRAPEVPWVPVLQGWERGDYLRHAEWYEREGVDLAALPRVGLGSVCRRQTMQIAWRLALTFEAWGYKLHGFGFKTTGLGWIWNVLTSADSLAWSVSAWHSPALPGHTHKACTSCMEFALAWRARMIEQMPGETTARPGETKAPAPVTKAPRRETNLLLPFTTC